MIFHTSKRRLAWGYSCTSKIFKGILDMYTSIVLYYMYLEYFSK